MEQIKDTNEKTNLYSGSQGWNHRTRMVQKEDRPGETKGTPEKGNHNRATGNEVRTFPFTRWREKVKPSAKLYNRKKENKNGGIEY